MPPNGYEKTVQLSVLDRLVDTEPEVRSEAPITRSESLRRLRQSVKRDLEWLLNTSRIADEFPEAYVELRNSLWVYGIPDIASVTLNSAQDEQRLLRGIEEAISNFEPRLARVRVVCFDRITKKRAAIEFHIEAVLLVDPAPERIAFDTVLEMAKGSYTVKD
jgi:type VI secretion system protein ImpF